MSRRNQRNILLRDIERPVIWLDVEMRKYDSEPALTSVHWPADDLKTYVHNPILEASAKAWKLEFQPWAQLADEIICTAMATNSLIAGYSLFERDLLMAACPEKGGWVEENYGNANVAKWFKRNRPELYAEACRLAGERNRPGLKDFLIQPAVGYPFKKYLRDVQPGPILGRLRELLAKRDGKHRKLTKQAKGDWRHLIEYNQEDVLGMIHLVEYVRREERKGNTGGTD
jgi:hypothetical protein